MAEMEKLRAKLAAVEMDNAALLDQLMGADRNVSASERSARNIWDRGICPFFLCGLSPWQELRGATSAQHRALLTQAYDRSIGVRDPGRSSRRPRSPRPPPRAQRRDEGAFGGAGQRRLQQHEQPEHRLVHRHLNAVVAEEDEGALGVLPTVHDKCRAPKRRDVSSQCGRRCTNGMPLAPADLLKSLHRRHVAIPRHADPRIRAEAECTKMLA